MSRPGLVFFHWVEPAEPNRAGRTRPARPSSPRRAMGSGREDPRGRQASILPLPEKNVPAPQDTPPGSSHPRRPPPRPRNRKTAGGKRKPSPWEVAPLGGPLAAQVRAPVRPPPEGRRTTPRIPPLFLLGAGPSTLGPRKRPPGAPPPPLKEKRFPSNPDASLFFCHRCPIPRFPPWPPKLAKRRSPSTSGNDRRGGLGVFLPGGRPPQFLRPKTPRSPPRKGDRPPALGKHWEKNPRKTEASCPPVPGFSWALGARGFCPLGPDRAHPGQGFHRPLDREGLNECRRPARAPRNEMVPGVPFRKSAGSLRSLSYHGEAFFSPLVQSGSHQKRGWFE